MKKVLLFFIFAVVIIVNTVSAQGGWDRKSSNPQNNSSGMKAGVSVSGEFFVVGRGALPTIREDVFKFGVFFREVSKTFQPMLWAGHFAQSEVLSQTIQTQGYHPCYGCVDMVQQVSYDLRYLNVNTFGLGGAFVGKSSVQFGVGIANVSRTDWDGEKLENIPALTTQMETRLHLGTKALLTANLWSSTERLSSKWWNTTFGRADVSILGDLKGSNKAFLGVAGGYGRNAVSGEEIFCAGKFLFGSKFSNVPFEFFLSAGASYNPIEKVGGVFQAGFQLNRTHKRVYG